MARVAPAQRQAVVSGRIRSRQAHLGRHALGRGLMDAVEIVNNVAETAERAESHCSPRRARSATCSKAAGSTRWPIIPGRKTCELDVRPVRLAQTTNAGLHRLAEQQVAGTEAVAGELRVRVSNDAGFDVDEFQLHGSTTPIKPIDEPIAVYVPAGESRVVRVRRPTNAAASRLQLSGDDHDFDNTLYLATRAEAERSVIYLGNDRADDPQGLRYYLERALTDGLAQPVKFVAAAPDAPLAIESPTETPLVVVDRRPGRRSSRRACGNMSNQAARCCLCCRRTSRPRRGHPGESIWHEPRIDFRRGSDDRNNYTMLGQIAFDHPLFAPMAGPHFNDFTQIHFWKYRQIKPEQLTARTSWPASKTAIRPSSSGGSAKGGCIVLTSGWQPADSQLARSWKFVLLVSALVEGGRGGRVGPRVFRRQRAGAARRGEERCASRRRSPSRTERRCSWRQTSAHVRRHRYARRVLDSRPPTAREQFAVNLDPLESRTSAVGVETLEQLGCRLVGERRRWHTMRTSGGNCRTCSSKAARSCGNG